MVGNPRGTENSSALSDPQDHFAVAGAAPLRSLKTLGKALLDDLHAAGFETVGELWFTFPLRFEDRTQILPLGALRPGASAQFIAQVEHAEIRFGKRRSLCVLVGDGAQRLMLRFFYFKQAQADGFKVGQRILVFGDVKAGPNSLEIVHPRYKLIGEHEVVDVAAALTPIYPTIQGLGPARLMRAIDAALMMLPQSDGWVPPGQHWPDLSTSIRALHRPSNRSEADAIKNGHHPARDRLALEELLAHHLSFRLVRQRVRSERAPVLRATGRLRERLLASVGFSLTQAQQRVLTEIDRDLASSAPMLRLIQGDVGSGKTIVAALAMLAAIESGVQAALMAPTELLAEQHRRNLERWFAPLGLFGVHLSARVKGRARTSTLAALSSDAQWIVGTHALMQDAVAFRALGLVVIDEQHRFGVDQRLALAHKGRFGTYRPHQLVMTATPIPRTLAMTQFADLDVSVIDELPPGRSPVQTVAVSRQRRADVVRRIADACAAGRQAYWVCTLIEDSDEVQAQAAESTATELIAALGDVRIGLVHGRMKSSERTPVMQAFSSGDIQLLVATTVIEVGVDVPNASLMIIENPERLGLAQLHQLRGRVGRGAIESSCVLLYEPPLSENARERLGVLRDSQDGFVIAERDLALRGPGEVLGTRQTGLASFRVADLARDAHWLMEAQRLAGPLLAAEPAVAEMLVKRWVGSAVQYAKA